MDLATYDTETVRQLLGLRTLEDVRNLTRPGKPLHEALVRRGSFNRHKVNKVQEKFIRRALAAQLGRISPRFLDNSHSRHCPQCPGVAVEWEGSQLCENGHNTPAKEDQSSSFAGAGNKEEANEQQSQDPKTTAT